MITVLECNIVTSGILRIVWVYVQLRVMWPCGRERINHVTDHVARINQCINQSLWHGSVMWHWSCDMDQSVMWQISHVKRIIMDQSYDLDYLSNWSTILIEHDRDRERAETLCGRFSHRVTRHIHQLKWQGCEWWAGNGIAITQTSSSVIPRSLGILDLDFHLDLHLDLHLNLRRTYE